MIANGSICIMVQKGYENETIIEKKLIEDIMAKISQIWWKTEIFSYSTCTIENER